MRPTKDGQPLTSAPPPPVSSESVRTLEDPRVIQAVREYLAALEGGGRPDRREFLARSPEIAGALAGCLDALEFVHVAVSSLHGAAIGHPAATDVTGAEFAAATPLGDYRILREIGRGGMGVVYEAEQLSLGRRVALKVLPFAAALDAKQLQRFKNEAQAAAHLHHPHIVPVHAVGCERGVHFYVMQMIEGQTLAALIRELRQRARPFSGDRRNGAGPANASANELGSERKTSAARGRAEEPPTGPYAPAPRADTAAAIETGTQLAALATEGSKHSAFFRSMARLGVQAAEALEHAHGLGVVHRDIKPANLLVDAEGNLWITDFGLARLGNDAGLTMTGDLLGTIRYMSPEQALAKRVAVDQRTDVYSLGVTLYEVLTLEPAYDGRNRQEVLRQIAFEEPPPPRRRNPAVPAELETIVLKAMAKIPEERYASAQELADDLRRFLEDKPIKARRPTLRQRSAKWARRHRTVVRAAMAGFALAVVGLAISTALIWRANEELKQVIERERQGSYFKNIGLAEREWAANNLGRMEQLLEECPADLRGWEWRCLRRRRSKSLAPLRHEGAVLDAVFSPDGRRIASACQDGVVKVWDVQTGEEVFTFKAHEKYVSGVAFSPDGYRLATVGRWEGTVKVWDARTGELIRALKGTRGSLATVAFSPDGRHVASGGGQGREFGEVKIWDATTYQGLFTWSDHTGIVTHVAFSPDGQLLASASHDGTVKVWEVATGRERLTFRGHGTQVRKVAFSPDAKQLASAAGDITTLADGEVKVWDVRTGREVLTLRGHMGPILSVAWSPDARRLVTGGSDKTVKIWEAATGREVLTLRGHHAFWVSAVAFSPDDGNRLLSACQDRTVWVWDATPLGERMGEEILTLRGHRGGVRKVAFRPDGRRLASAGDDGVIVWDPQTGTRLRTLVGDTGVMTDLAFSSRGRRLALGSQRLKVWDTTIWKEVVVRSDLQQAVTFSPDGRYLASCGLDYSVKLLDLANYEVIRNLRGHTWGIFTLDFSPDSQILASASADSSVRLWQVATGEEIEVPRLRHKGPATSVRWCPDGRRLASASQDGTVIVWDTATWKELLTFHDATGGVQSAVWSPDGRRIAWGSTDATVKVGDLVTGEVLRTLRGHTNRVMSVAFSPDGRWLVSASLDGTVKIWKASTVGELPGPVADNPGM